MKIKDLCSYAPKSRIKAGEAVDNAKYLFFTSSADENKRYTDFQFDKEAIIMGTGGNATLHYHNEKFSVSTDCLVLLPDPQIKCKYLYYFFKSHMNVLEAGFKGAGLKHTNKKYIEDIEINKVPDLITQDRIISRLDKISENIEKLNRELGLFDSLVKARFVEMFGDPLINTKKWKECTIGELATDVRYGTSKPSVDGGKYPYLRMNNLTNNGELDLTDLKYIDVSDDEKEKCVVRKGDILFNRTNSIDLVGKTTLFNLDEEMIIAGYIIRVRLNSQILPEILAQYMNSSALKKLLRKMAKGAVNQANINAQELQSIKVYVPDLELQNRFSNFVQQVDKSKYDDIRVEYKC